MNTELIVLIVSFVLLVIGVILFQKGKHLLKNGIKANATIFENNFHPGNSGGKYFPVVRFLTDTNEWITQELSTGYFPAKPIGKSIEVLYDPENPTKVEINSNLQLQILPAAFVVIGIIGIAVGLLEYFAIIDFIPLSEK